MLKVNNKLALAPRSATLENGALYRQAVEWRSRVKI
jgi:hypothetical protein